MAEPSSWPKSDVPLEQRVRSYLDGKGSGTFRAVRVAVHTGTVTLTGTVTSFYAKQIAQEFTRRVPGVVAVVNLIEVTE
jgi:osmotically-inducible protein OsmY